jgi:hypothetical protein
MPTINRLIHNCWPNDTGRTNYRKRRDHTAANALHRAMTVDHRFQDCDHLTTTGDVYSADIWSFFSAHDIHPEEFIREMASSGSDTAVLALHLPFPLLDRRVRSYTDTTVGLHYEVEGEKLLVYHLESGSAGYAHDFEKVYAWMHNMPIFPNAHVQVEVISQIGTAVLFSLTIGEGSQETVPSLWSCQREPFYILPELMDTSLRVGERPHFAVTARRFEQLVAYVATLDPIERTLSNVVAKLRGMLAEIRVGIHTIEQRWSVTIPQLYSLIEHCLLAHEIHLRSTKASSKLLSGYYSRVAWRNGTFLKRFLQQRIDLLLFRAGGETDPLACSSFRWFFSNRLDHKHTYNPYQRAGEYRVVNLDNRYSNRIAPKRFAKAPLRWSKLVVSSVWQLSCAVPRFHPTRPAPPKQTFTESKREAFFEDSNYFDDFEDDDAWQPAYAPQFWFEPEVAALDTVVHTEFLYSQPPPVPAPQIRSTFKPDWDSLYDATDSDSVLTEPVAIEEPVVASGALEPDASTFDIWLDVNSKAGNLQCVPSHLASEKSSRVIDFLAPLLPVSRQHPADDAISRLLGRRFAFVWPPEPIIVPAPSRGAVHIIEAAVDDNSQQAYPETFLPSLNKYTTNTKFDVRRIVRMFEVGIEEGTEKHRALVAKFTRFAECCVSAPGNLRVKLLMVEGPAMSAKSSLVRTYVRSRLKSALVYVPSGKLRKDWLADTNFSQHAEVLTRHSVPRKRGGYQVGVIDEVFNFEPAELYLHLRVLRSAGCTTVLMLGDRSQREPTGIDLDHPYFARRLELHTSLGMPRDAHALYVKRNSLDPLWYDTTGEVETSLLFTSESPDFAADLTFKMHGYAGDADTDLTVGKVQGSRAEVAVFEADTNLRQASWLNDSPNRFSVAFTRHTRALVIHSSAAVAESFVGVPLKPYVVVGYKREDMQHTLHPDVLDDLVKPIRSARVIQRRALLRATLQDPLVLEGHAVRIEKPIVEPPEPLARGSVLRSELANFCLENSNFELVEPAERDLETDQPKRQLTFSAPGPPVQRTDVRNDLPGSDKLAAIHVNSSGFDSFKNLVDRQIATTKSSRFGSADIVEGVKIYQRFKECFYAEGCTLLDIEKQASWLAETEINALNQIASGDPLGESPRSLTVDAEFKTQTKAKAIPGFSATLPYGQSILANSKSFNAYFANQQPKLYLNLTKILRPGAIVDYGMSDDVLSARLRKLGIASDLNGPNNIQADVSKQDSSHTAAFLYAFVLIARDCGLAEEPLQLYMAFCRRYHFRSRGSDATRSTVSFNLGSGDPFTLIRNDIMEMCTIACNYTNADTMMIVEKGDDVHGVIANLAPHPLATLPSIAQVKLTVDLGVVGYHAGRFHNGHRYLVDPVRAFLKHFTRLSDSNVSNAELFASYISRATDYSDSEVEFLLKACQIHYAYYSSSQVSVMIDTMIALRDRSTFEKYSVIRLKDHFIIVDTKSDCAVNCVRALRPGRSHAYYRQFRGMRLDYLVQELQREGLPVVVSDGGIYEQPVNTVVLSDSHARVKLKPALLRL